MKKKWIILLMIIACLLSLALSACNQTDAKKQGDSTPTAQQVAEAAVAAKTEALPDYNFAEGNENSEAVAAREGDADAYLVGQADGAQKLVYVYQDISYDQNSSYRYIDVYMPNAKEKLAPETPVFLYLHGGGWVAGSRKDERKTLMPYIASTGMVVVSMEYALWFGLNQQESTPLGVYSWEQMGVMEIINTVLKNEHPVSVADQQADITACLTFLRDTYLPSLGLTATNIGIGGYSAGGHLSSLYAYKNADKSPMPIAYLMDLVGPVKLLDENYKRLLDMLTGHVEDAPEAAADVLKFVSPLLEDLAAPLAGILGEEEPVNISTEEGYQHALASIAALQPIDYLNENSVPTIICYARQHDDMPIIEVLFECEVDDFIPITIYQSISAKLDETGIVHEDKMFDNATHNTIGKNQDSCKWMAARVSAYASLYGTYAKAQ
ncbi:MAG: alpha/beta hydrolase [Clostridia bacterium]|nr:alpha/beta hydrolase [Clostridia bacterium]